MRRTVVLTAGVCAALLVAGVATAATYSRTDGQRPTAAVPSRAAVPSPAVSHAPLSPRPSAVFVSPSAVGETRAARAAEPKVGREQVGVIETVTRIVGYERSTRSTEFRYPGADYVKVHFNRLLMLPGDYLTVSDPAGKEVHRYDADPVAAVGEQVAESGRWAMSVTGESAVVTLHNALPDPLGVRSVRVDKVARGFTPAEKAARSSRSSRNESVCGNDDEKDAVCYKSSDPVAYARSKAVARLLINGNELCSAWRIGRSNRMVTNHHCFTTSDEAYNTEVWFDYQCAKCGGYETFQPTKVWGDKVLSTDETLDFTLFSLDDFEAVQRFGYLDLDLSRPRSGQEVYIPQHPAGKPGMISMGSDKDRAGTCAVADPIYDGYAKDTDVSYLCDTEGGSSGSPVISRASNKVLALHHWGGCPNSGVRIDLVYNKIKSSL